MDGENHESKDIVLIVDDVPKNIQYLGTLLREEGYGIAFARNGEEALERMRALDLSLVLLDIMMPGMDGFQVIGEVKKDPELAGVPVIFLTAKTDTDDIVNGFTAGAVDYITKPFNPAELLSRVKTHVELKRSRDTITRQKEELEQLNAMKDRFFSIIAHDLKNPFNSLLGLTDLLIKNYESMDDARKRVFIKDIHDSSNQVYRLLENLLEWSRIQTGRMPWNPRSIVIGDLTSVVISLFRQSANEKRINLKVEGDLELRIFADKNMMETILRNLVSNAIKFTGEGGSVAVALSSKADMTVVSVRDTGLGMTIEEISLLFRIDVHHTTPGAGNEKGTGLGLILCEDLVKRNNGTITVESEKGRGSVFTLILPSLGNITLQAAAECHSLPEETAQLPVWNNR